MLVTGVTGSAAMARTLTRPGGAGADRSIAAKSGTTALEHAEGSGYEEIARLLRG